ncbi:MAG: insulinase family protein [Lachnospiraceae bacterium]|nr:insulinase family protein [Lachnospiraceae bacterium]
MNAAYEKLEEQYITEYETTAVSYRHKKTGARVLTLSCEDENKVFIAGFRTPAHDDTGVAHITEHSVLCGSEKYPVKDPFVELVKGSLNTFLNAITYADKTLYPVASCNEKDFRNLMDVYLDGVFHPNIYQNEKIFRQEGWHYELEQEDGPLTVNGVVYNEMKGALSSPDSVLGRETMHALFPDTTYAFESGGKPESIPSLSYEAFLDFHRRYYHPSNSYLYLYGDMDMDEYLTYLDQNYLSQYEERQIDSRIRQQALFSEKQEKALPVNAALQEGEWLSFAVITGEETQAERLGFQVLKDVLMDAPGAVVKQRLTDLQLGKEIGGRYATGLLQPYFGVTVKGAAAGSLPRFQAALSDCLREVAKNGIPEELLEASLHSLEFQYREADFGRFPAGLMLGIRCYESWIYRDETPWRYLPYDEAFRELKEKAKEGFFQTLVKERLLDNPHGVWLTLYPQPSLLAEKEQQRKETLAALLGSWSAKERQMAIDAARALKAWQDTEDSAEALATIPLLKREDLEKKVRSLDGELLANAAVPTFYTRISSARVSYLTASFDVSDVPREDYPVLGILKEAIGLMDTKEHSFRDLAAKIRLQTGGVYTRARSFERQTCPEKTCLFFEFTASFLPENTGEALGFIREMAACTRWEDGKRFRQILAEVMARLERNFLQNGHRTAILRATAGIKEGARFGDETREIGFYAFLQEAAKGSDEELQTLLARCQTLCQKCFTRERLRFSYTGDEEGKARFLRALPAFLAEMGDGKAHGCAEEAYEDRKHSGSAEETPENGENSGAAEEVSGIAATLKRRREAFRISSDVQYTALSGSFAQSGLPYTGALRVARLLLEYDFLWQKIRLQGGAYGANSGFSRGGRGYFASYRDPELKKTLEVYRQIPEYFRNYNGSEREITKAVIGSISSLDAPLTKKARGEAAYQAFLEENTEEQRQKERDEVLHVTREDIQALAPYMEAILQDCAICALGSENKIREAEAVFEEIEELF